ncbi:putative flagellar biogenesis protein [Yersinia aldovae]|uniref:flagellar basal body-associated FliL family protein n=1 Tax=Yersinia aldovae TaxID=29483 RepID=UPI0005DDAABE|nr:flagellar basal body-associated FliL family protein [Yersinia aldovae]CNH98647.1 putative flagellar biogenesis protein [Yersinia aldovae]
MNRKKVTFPLKIWLFLLLAILATITLLGCNTFWAKLNRELVTTGKSFVRGEKTVQFVEIKNMIITLNDNKSERYLQLELGIATGDDDDVKRVIAMVPVIRAATVNLLSNRDYQTVRQISITDLRRQLMDEYRKEFEYLNSEMPFDGVVISRMVFQ